MSKKIEIDLDCVKLSNDKESINIRNATYHMDINHHIKNKVKVSSTHNLKDGGSYIVLSIGSYNVFIEDIEMMKAIKEAMDQGIDFIKKWK